MTLQSTETANLKGYAQFALPLARMRRFSPHSFVSAPANAEARAWVERGAWPEGRLWLWGDEGTGKTHLAAIWAGQRDALYLRGTNLTEQVIATLSSNARSRDAAEDECYGINGVVIDEADRPRDGRILLHIVNMLRERQVPLLLVGRLPPSRVTFTPPDLASRLRACTSVQVGGADDTLLETLLMRLIAEREMIVARPVLDWLHRHLPRSPGIRVRAIEWLDGVALAAGRPIGISLARKALGAFLTEGGL